MGTRGYYVFRYKNKWYVFYNKFDSYPDGLGQLIVDELKNIDIEALKDVLDRITSDDVLSDGNSFGGLMNAAADPTNSHLVEIKYSPAGIEYDIEYVYTIDIDKKMFNVEYIGETRPNTQRFPLNAIPDNWQEYIIEEC